MGEPAETTEARARARVVLWLRDGAAGGALAAAAVLLYASSRAAGHGLPGLILTLVAAGLVLIVVWVAADLALVRRPMTPAVVLAPEDAPDLHRMVAELAAGLGVPEPVSVRLCPDCDSWLEQDPRDPRRTVLVIGAPFLWWLRVDELRALLAPVIAGTAASADRRVAGARRWVRRLDAVADVRRPPGPPPLRPARRLSRAFARQLLEPCRGHAELMERGIAAGAAVRALPFEPGLRATAHEQVGLAYAGWDRLLSRLAAPAWRIGRRPDALMAGVVLALTELSRRDRLATGFGARLRKRPAKDLLTDPTRIDAEISRLAAAVFADNPAPRPVSWADYPEQVIEQTWRLRADAPHRGRTPPTSGRAPDATRVEAALAELLELRRGPGGSPVPDDGTAFDPATHLYAVAACAALGTGRVRPAVDWLDGPVLVDVRGDTVDLAGLVAHVVDDGDEAPLRAWLGRLGVRTREPVPGGGRPGGA